MPYGILLEEYNAHGYWCRWKYQAKAELIGNGDSSKAKIILEQWHEAERMGM